MKEISNEKLNKVSGGIIKAVLVNGRTAYDVYNEDLTHRLNNAPFFNLEDAENFARNHNVSTILAPED